MPELREVELRIAVAEGVLSRAEADALGEEARRKKQSPLAILVEQGRLSEDSFQSILAEALNDPAVRAAGRDVSASTYTMQVPPPSADEPAFPVAGWERYTSVRFLGQGGMGMVFLAIDTRLRREVAIKFVRGNDAEHVRRLITEARTQARVSHERICKVYEVGEVEGKVYIAMQYIEGKPLGRLSGELTVEQKVMLVRGAAEGIHEAHREGIIHRDLKPSNIMVERSDDGALRPYVMDFGLARSAQEAGETMTGAVMGTPRYMAPEQAQGASAKLDRRADVYSLGATLYHLLTGEPAVPGETVAEVIHNLISVEPRPLRTHDPHIPIDLEAIVLKCLEKDRSARYDSARALADDLGRFLNGEPVIARPAGAWYRLRKRIIKHRRLVAAGAAALVVLGVAIGWGIKTRLQAAEREELARRFTEEVEGIEAMARYSALSPRHDIRGDQAQLRARMGELEREIERAGDVAAGPGHYALGRGYLALGDDVEARAHLAAAWNHSFREPRVAYAMAQAMGHLYQDNLLAAERIEDKGTREAKKRVIERLYRDPALGFLAESEGAKELPSQAYVAALVAYYETRFADALNQVDAIDARAWFYEAPKLRGDILVARALAFRDSGEHERARDDFAAGRKAYAAAAAIGESIPAIYESLADLEHAEMTMELYGHGDVTPSAGRALAATAQALAIEPDHYEALVLDARIRRGMAEYQTIQGVNAENLLDKARADARRAVDLSPERSEARLEVARIYRQWGFYRKERHDDPSEQFRQAVAASDSIPSADRDTTYYVNLGLALSVWADYEDENGGDGQAHRDQSIAFYKQALRYAEAFHRADQQRDTWINVAINLFKRATVSRAKDPDADLQQALTALGTAKRIDHQTYVLYYCEGQIYEALAQRSRASGRDPRPDLNRALAAYRSGIDVNPTNANLHNGVGGVFQVLANLAWDHGEDPGPLLQQAQAGFEQAISVAPEQGYGYDNVGEALVQRAGFQRARGADPSASVTDAVAMLNQAIEKNPNHPTFRADLAMAYSILAGYELEHGRDPQPSLRGAAAALQPALDSHSSDPQVQIYAAEIQGLYARLAARQGHGKAGEFKQVAEAFERAFALAPDNEDRAILFGQFCRTRALFERDSHGDPEPAVKRGLELARQVGRRRGSPDALVLQASLTLLRAGSSGDAAERRAQAENARRNFNDAFTANRSLENVWASEAALAKQLAGP